jgi:hypothetical protein
MAKQNTKHPLTISMDSPARRANAKYATRRNRFAFSFEKRRKFKKRIHHGDTEDTEKRERKERAMRNAKCEMKNAKWSSEFSNSISPCFFSVPSVSLWLVPRISRCDCACGAVAERRPERQLRAPRACCHATGSATVDATGRGESHRRKRDAKSQDVWRQKVLTFVYEIPCDSCGAREKCGELWPLMNADGRRSGAYPGSEWKRDAVPGSCIL